MRKPSTLLEYLPAIYQSDPFIGQYLLAFEKVLLGIDDDVKKIRLEKELEKELEKGLEETIANIAIYFKPFDPAEDKSKQTPEDFLSWLSGWVALSLRADLSEQQQRQFIASMIQLYRKRGTKENLKKILQIFIQGEPEIIETSNAEFQVGISILGQTTYLGGGSPHFFEVNIKIKLPNGLSREQILRKQAIAEFVIDLEKPAHTKYRLNPPDIIGTLTVGKSKVGIDTFFGIISPSNP